MNIDQEPPEEDLSYFKAPQITKHGSRIIVDWPGRGLTFIFESLHENNNGLKSELEITSSTLGRLYWGQLGLTSISGQESLIKKLKQTYPPEDLAWLTVLIEKTFYAVAQVHRAGEPVYEIEDGTDEIEEFMLEPIIPKDQTSIIYGDGGSCKSYLSLFLAVAIAFGKDLPQGLRPQKSRVLILDWETSKADCQKRLRRICKALGLTLPGGIFYRKMYRSLADDVESIKKEVSERKIGLLIIDSIVPACGSEPESADSNIKLFNALRDIPTTNLIIAHVSKQSVENTGPSRPYGSVFVSNLARSTWEVRATPDEVTDAVNIGLHHRKCNSGKLRPPMGFQIAFDSEMVLLHGMDLSNEPDLIRSATISYRIQSVLKKGSMTTKEISESVAAPFETVKTACYRLFKKSKLSKIENEDKTISWGVSSSVQ